MKKTDIVVLVRSITPIIREFYEAMCGRRLESAEFRIAQLESRLKTLEARDEEPRGEQ